LIQFAKQDDLNIDQILGPGGLVAKSYAGFETRPQQLKMAKAVKHALEKNRHLTVEAGTGVGKSFAYLISAIDKARQKKRKVLISTYTITLQQQLINKDIPFLSEILPWQFTAVLAKGRGNYLCKRRLEYAQRKQKGYFDDVGIKLLEINEWSRSTNDGSLSDLDSVPDTNVWDAVRSEHGNCKSRKCPFFSKCFYWKARRSLETADIIVANHALMFSDLILKEASYGVLPDYDCVIIDEAHNIEHVAEDHFGINITNFTITFLLRKLYNTKTRKGLLAFSDTTEAIEFVKQCQKQAKLFFAQVQAWFEHSKDGNGKCYADFVDDNITDPIKQLRLSLTKASKDIKDEDEMLEYERYIDRCKGLETQLKDFLTQPNKENVYWVEISNSKRTRISLRSAPINAGPYVKQTLFDKFDSVIMTSATLSCGKEHEKEGFDFFAGRIGLEDYDAVKLGSPFDYQKQVTMYIEADLPEPNHQDFIRQATETLKKYITKTDGKAFVLFTSYAMLKKMADILEDWFADSKIELLTQGSGVDRSVLLEEFKLDERSVLFGTDSFWQGVDVPGDALSNVMIVRLPFAVPNHPLIQGRIEKIKKDGDNPFFKYQLPTAIIKFKQGFGRLVRSKTDTGIVVVLDSRIVHKRYGQNFLQAIPPCQIEVVSNKYDQ
jgi:ATP-dependent DNA helicase DinG